MPKTKRFYKNDDTDELIILTEEEGAEPEIQEIPLLMWYEVEEELEDEKEPESEKVENPKKRGRPKADESWRNKGRVSAQQKELITSLLKSGKNTRQVSEETGIELEKVNRVAEKMYDPKTEEEKGVSL